MAEGGETDAVVEESAVEQAIRIARALEPEQWAKIDHIAAMIDPGAFAQYFDGVGPDARELFDARGKYLQSRARHLAYEIMVYLGAAPATTNWTPIFERMVIENDARGQSHAPNDRERQP